MCHHFNLKNLNIELLRIILGHDFPADIAPILETDFTPYNSVPVILDEDSGLTVKNMYWCLIPNFFDEFKPKYNWFNIQREKLTEPYQKSRLQDGRCIIPVSAFSENKELDGKPVYRTVGKTKKKESYSFSHKDKDNPVLFLGGIYDSWEKDGHEQKYSCSIITLPPNEIIGEVHPRMPFILSEEDVKVWLDKTVTDTSVVLDLIKPYPSEFLIRQQEWPPADQGDLFG